jgi:N-acylneuraminate cytidylyltransferase
LAVIAVIPARGGSKGVPRKNLRSVGGITLLQRAIDAGRNASGVDRVVVSTDDAEMAAAARAGGAETVDRPASLAGDEVRTAPVVLHAIDVLDVPDDDVVVVLQPTSPLRSSKHVERCVALFAEGASASVLSVVRPGHHPHKSFVVDGDGARPMIDAPSLEAPRQTLPEVVQPNGAVYVLSARTLREQQALVVFPVATFEMSALESLDIDDAADLVLAEAAAGLVG